MSEMKKELKENKMGVMPVPKLLIGMSLPMMISMLVQALYNIVDSMFVAKLSEDALTAVSRRVPASGSTLYCQGASARKIAREPIRLQITACSLQL